MKRIVSGTSVLILLVTFPVMSQLPVRHMLPVEVAKEMAEVAQNHCRDLGYNISVHVVDNAGDTLVAYRGDGTGVHTFVNSYRKAYTAMTFDRPTSVFRQRLDNGDIGPELQLMLPETAGQQGGIPVRVGDEVIGGIGASGGGSGSDAICSQAGIDAVADQLK
ncbi:MAG: heme-binding protein [Gammaproteobacteria bacterium]|nr:heme-binding protein [Gammaproteobacteria bacterium]